MKKRVFLAAAAIALLAYACTMDPDEKEIRANAEGYLQAVGDYHFDDALPYSSRHTREKTIPVFKELLECSDTAYVNSNRPSEFTFNEVRRTSDTTAVIYYHKHTPIKDVDDSLTLLYEDGHWLADVHLGVIPFLNSTKENVEPNPFPDIKNFVKHPASELKPSDLIPKGDSVIHTKIK